MPTNYVKFQRGTQSAYNKLIDTNHIDDNTLYFIYPDNDKTIGKLYLGARLINNNDISLNSVSLSDLNDVIIESIKATSFLVQNSEGKWTNISLPEVIKLINFISGNGINIDNNIIGIKINPNEKNLTVNASGLSTNFDLTDYVTKLNLEEKVEQLSYITCVDSDVFEIKEIQGQKILQLKNVPSIALTLSVGDLNEIPTIITKDGEKSNSIVDNINYLHDNLTWRKY